MPISPTGKPLPYPPSGPTSAGRPPGPLPVPTAPAPPAAGATTAPLPGATAGPLPGGPPGAGFDDPGEQMVMSFLSQRLTTLAPEDRMTLNRSITPELAMVLVKLFGKRIVDLLDPALMGGGQPGPALQLSPGAGPPLGGLDAIQPQPQPQPQRQLR